MKPIEIYYIIENTGDGEARLVRYLTDADAEIAEDNLSEGWGGSCRGSIETYEGSEDHLRAIENSRRLNYTQ